MYTYTSAYDTGSSNKKPCHTNIIKQPYTMHIHITNNNIIIMCVKLVS